MVVWYLIPDLGKQVFPTFPTGSYTYFGADGGSQQADCHTYLSFAPYNLRASESISGGKGACDPDKNCWKMLMLHFECLSVHEDWGSRMTEYGYLDRTRGNLRPVQLQFLAARGFKYRGKWNEEYTAIDWEDNKPPSKAGSRWSLKGKPEQASFFWRAAFVRDIELCGSSA